jgi:hypothetical protein
MKSHTCFDFFLQPISKDMFDEALKELQDEDYLIVTNKVIRLCS